MLEKIIKAGFCTGCGVCVSEDSSKKAFMKEDEFGFLIPHVDAVSLRNKESMLKVCPFNPDVQAINEDDLANKFLFNNPSDDPQIGRFTNLYVGYANEYRESSSSGGIATYIFKMLLKNKIVDNLFIVTEVKGKYVYQFFNSYKDIVKISKTRYIPVTLEQLFLEIEKVEGKIAVSGVGCFIKAIRLKQSKDQSLIDKIPFLVGIICGGLKSKFFTDFLNQSAQIDGAYHNQDYRIKNKHSSASDYSYGAYDALNKLHTVRMKSLGDMWGTGLFKSNACDLCDDVTTELADISLGDAWLEPYVQEGLGTSVIVTRSKLADMLINLGMQSDELTLNLLDLSTFKKSQQGSFNHRHNGLKFRKEKLTKKFGVTPSVRPRFLIDIPFEQKIVQLQRMKLRRKSLLVWKKTQSLKEFNSALRTELMVLKIVTKINQRLRKYR